MKHNFFIYVVLTILVSGCASWMPPKTANEFRQTSRERKGVHKMVANANLETVMGRITTHAQKCNSLEWSVTRREGMGGNPASSTYSDRQLIRWENKNSNKPTFIISSEGKQDINRQKGGFFMFLMDLEDQGAQTKVTMYDYNFSYGYYDWATEFKSVINGEKATCQLEKAK